LLSTFRDKLSGPSSDSLAVLWIGSLLSTFRDKLSGPSSDSQAVLWIGSLLSTFRDKLSGPSSDSQAVLWIGSLLSTFRDKLSAHLQTVKQSSGLAVCYRRFGTSCPRYVKSPDSRSRLHRDGSLKPNTRKRST